MNHQLACVEKGSSKVTAAPLHKEALLEMLKSCPDVSAQTQTYLNAISACERHGGWLRLIYREQEDDSVRVSYQIVGEDGCVLPMDLSEALVFQAEMAYALHISTAGELSYCPKLSVKLDKGHSAYLSVILNKETADQTENGTDDDTDDNTDEGQGLGVSTSVIILDKHGVFASSYDVSREEFYPDLHISADPLKKIRGVLTQVLDDEYTLIHRMSAEHENEENDLAKRQSETDGDTSEESENKEERKVDDPLVK